MTDDICTACERDSLDCSKEPCPDVIADRGELWRVTFTAKNIQITSEDDNDGTDPAARAERYAMDDARQFRTAWNYEPPEVEALGEGEEITEDVWEIETEVTQTEHEGDTFTFDATYSLVVEGEDEAAAITAARQIMGITR